MFKESLATEVSPKQEKKPANNFQPVLLYSKFRTKDRYYIYDTHSNEILQVSQVTYDIIDEYLKDGLQNKKKELSAKFNYPESEIQKAIDDIEEGKRNGYLKPTDIRKMNFYENNDDLIADIKIKIKSLGLENTTNCNLRCKYCCYSGHYPRHRTHQRQDMDWETARNAVDIFMRHSSGIERKNIGFWGGEPLANFPLIEKVVNYVKEKYPGETMVYNFTTNGTLFNDENIEFLIKHKFLLQVSLNGPQHIHDKYRVDINGKGTFNTIVKSLHKIIEKDYEYYKEYIKFICTLTPGTDFADVEAFFSGDELFKDKTDLSITSIDAEETTFFEKHGYYTVDQLRELDKRYYEAAINNRLVEDKFIKYFNENMMVKIFKRCRHELENRMTPNGCCIPMLKKMHVDINGNINVCERLPGYNSLGNVNKNGIDYPLIVKFIEKYTGNSLKDCRRCWALRFCSACFREFIRNHEWYDKNRQGICEDIRNNTLSKIRLYSAIMEKNPAALNYMKDIKITM